MFISRNLPSMHLSSWNAFTPDKLSSFLIQMFPQGPPHVKFSSRQDLTDTAQTHIDANARLGCESQE